MPKYFEQESKTDSSSAGSVIKMIVITVAVLFVALIFNPVSCVNASERGLKFRFGEVQNKVYMPGIVTHIPFIEQVKTYSIVPNKEIVAIDVGKDGAITTDNQTVGAKFEVYWRLDEAKLLDYARSYSNERLAEIISMNTKSAIKTVIGTYTIFDLASRQQETTGKVANLIFDNTSKYPIIVVDIKNTNYDWSDDFDEAIKTTQKLKQEVLQKEQDVSKQTLEYQKQVAEAEAQKKVVIANAEAQLAAAKLSKEAKIAEGEGIKRYNELVAMNWNIELKKMELEIEKARVERWDGHYVPAQNFTALPLGTTSGVIGTGK